MCMYQDLFLLQPATFFGCSLALESNLPFSDTSWDNATPLVLVQGDLLLFFSLLFLLHFRLELFYGMLGLCFLHADMPLRLVSC